MKKHLLTIFFVLFAAPMWAQVDKEADQKRYGKGQMPFNEKGEVVFSKVVQADGKDKNAIYQSARMLIVEMFKSAKDVVQMDDSDKGIIIAKGWSAAPGGESDNCKIWYTLKIQCRDGRYKVDVYQIKCTRPSDYVARITIPAIDMLAEELTDDVCIKPNGDVRTRGKGYWRRAVIDVANSVLYHIETNIFRNSSETSDVEDW